LALLNPPTEQQDLAALTSAQNTHRLSDDLEVVLLEQPPARTVYEQIAELSSTSVQSKKTDEPTLHQKVATILLDALKSVPEGGSALVDMISQLFGTSELANTEQHIAVRDETYGNGKNAKIFSMLFKQGEKVVMVNMPSAPVPDFYATDFKVAYWIQF